MSDISYNFHNRSIQNMNAQTSKQPLFLGKICAWDLFSTQIFPLAWYADVERGTSNSAHSATEQTLRQSLFVNKIGGFITQRT